MGMEKLFHTRCGLRLWAINMKLKYNNRKIEIEYSGTQDEPEIEVGCYLDGDEEELTMSELDEVMELHAESISEAIQQRIIDKSEDSKEDY
jgi:cell division ATPase FtsA